MKVLLAPSSHSWEKKALYSAWSRDLSFSLVLNCTWPSNASSIRKAPARLPVSRVQCQSLLLSRWAPERSLTVACGSLYYLEGPERFHRVAYDVLFPHEREQVPCETNDGGTYHSAAAGVADDEGLANLSLPLGKSD